MLKDRLRGVKSGIKRRIQDKLEGLSGPAETRTDDSVSDALVGAGNNRSELETSQADPPVVARLMVEIRSDGTRTIARGALKDELSGEQVSLVAKGSSPLSLAAQLAKNLLTTPLAAAQFARAVKRDKLARPKTEPPPQDDT